MRQPSDHELCPHTDRAIEWAHGWLTDEEAAAWRPHLERCQACAGIVAELRAERLGSAGGSTGEQPSSELPTRIMEAARPELERLRGRKLRRRWARPLASAALLLLTLGTMYWLWAPPSTGSAPDAELLKRCAWLQDSMGDDGSWGGTSRAESPANAVGLHSMALLALASVDLPASPDRVEHVLRGARWLMRQQGRDGLLGRSLWYESFDHPVSTLALLATWETTGDDAVREAADRAVACLVRTVDSQGLTTRNTGLAAWNLQTLIKARDLGWSGLSGAVSRARAQLGEDPGSPSPFARPELRALALGKPRGPVDAAPLGPVHAMSLAILDS